MSTQIAPHQHPTVPLRDELDDCISDYELTLEQESWPECQTCYGECYFVYASGQRYGFMTWVHLDLKPDPNVFTRPCVTCGGTGKQQPGPGEGGL